MICYGNNCNAGSIHRNLQPAYEPKSPVPVKPLLVIAPPEPKPPREHKRHRGRAVICVETGQRFESIALAAESIGVSTSSVRQASNPDCPAYTTAGGYHWRRV